MRTRHLIVAALLVAAAGTASASDDTPLCPSADGYRLAAGDYLETTYIETLHKSLSPLKAAKEAMDSGVTQAVHVAREGDLLKLLVVWNWHEGDWLFTLHPDGTLDRDRKAYRADTGSLEVLDHCNLRLSAPSGPVRTYRYVDSDVGYVGRVVLAGPYTDAKGRVFRFDPDGKAVFPDRTFGYTVELDQVLDQYDFFRVDDAQNFIAFRRDGARLTLYPVILEPDHGGFGRPDLDHPIAELRQTSAR